MFGTWSLRRRLVVGLVALLAIVSAVVGVTSVLALRQNLLARLDDQVRVTLAQIERPRPGGDGDGPPGRIGTIEVRVESGRIARADYIAENGETVALDADQRARITTLDLAPGEPRTVDLGGDVGPVRVIATPAGDGDRVIAGLRLAEVDTTTANLALIFALVTAAALVVAALLGSRAVTVALRPLGRMTATARRVAELPLARGEVALGDRVPDSDTDPGTEVGQVGAAFNRMLGHVEEALRARQQSEEKVRQFVADASHELRTPLASIRGYSEFTRRSGAELPPDIVHALARIESESVRMTSLVEDLLLLARLDAARDQPRRALSADPVDLGKLVADAVSDAHAAAPDHSWHLDLPSDPVLVAGDPHRLHQVVANLLANARSHTPPGTTVVASVRADAGSGVVAVEDDGPGIPADVAPVLFERFARGDASRSRQAGSTGLGLAIVAAVVEAHGGTVEVESAPGRTRFVVRLPVEPPPVGPPPADLTESTT